LAAFLERVEREQTDRRRQAAGGINRPFALTQRIHMLDGTSEDESH
jgi:hypothetical protein